MLSDTERRQAYDLYGITNEDDHLYKQRHDYSQYARFRYVLILNRVNVKTIPWQLKWCRSGPLFLYTILPVIDIIYVILNNKFFVISLQTYKKYCRWCQHKFIYKLLYYIVIMKLIIPAAFKSDSKSLHVCVCFLHTL